MWEASGSAQTLKKKKEKRKEKNGLGGNER
jgi:hypothetical protein